MSTTKSNAKPLVVVTGASSGIGQRCAKLFSEQGHSLLLLARRIDRLKAMDLPNSMCEQVDVTDLGAFQAAVKKAEAQFGPTECIINCAGLMLLGNVHTQDPAEWQTMLQVNVMGVLHGIRAVIDGMMARRSGTVINMSSVAGRNVYGNHGVYCATKFGVHALTETFRQEYSKYNIRFVTIAPGIVNTELLSHTTDQNIKDDYRESNKHVDPLIPEDIANACWYAFSQPPRCCIREIVICPTAQEK